MINGKPFNIVLYENIMKEIWYISKNIHTSYNDILKISVHERKQLVKLINEDFERQEAQIKKMKEQSKSKSKR